MLLTFSCIDSIKWISNEGNPKIELKHLTKMQARRMDSLTKSSLELALSISENQKVDYLVTASRHGQLHYSFDLIKEIINNETPSPTKFSQSTHNSIGGLYCILSKNKIPMTAISAGEKTKAMGFLAALNHLLVQPKENVLFLYTDGNIPEAYSGHISVNDYSNKVFCCLLSAGSDLIFNPLEPNWDFFKEVQNV